MSQKQAKFRQAMAKISKEGGGGGGGGNHPHPSARYVSRNGLTIGGLILLYIVR